MFNSTKIRRMALALWMLLLVCACSCSSGPTPESVAKKIHNNEQLTREDYDVMMDYLDDRIGDVMGNLIDEDESGTVNAMMELKDDELVELFDDRLPGYSKAMFLSYMVSGSSDAVNRSAFYPKGIEGEDKEKGENEAHEGHSPSSQSTQVTFTDPIQATEGVVDLKDDNKFRPGIKPGIVTVLDFNATWCVPCRKLTPALHKAADSYAGHSAFFSVDVDSLESTAAAYNVSSVPTVVIIAPDGNSKTVVGLGDFVKGSTATDGEDLTATIYSNLSAMVAEMAGK